MGTLGAALESIHAVRKPSDTPKTEKIVPVHYSKLHKSPFQYRDKGKSKDVIQREIESLAFDIKADGQIVEPLLVRKMGTDEYEIIAGHHRWEAAKYIVEIMGEKKFEFCPCIIKKVTEVQTEYMVNSSNNQRPKTDWEIMHELEIKRKLLEEHPEDFPHLKGAGRMIDKLAREVNLSKSTVGEYLQISKNLSDKGMEAFQSGELNKSAAVSMASLSPAEQDKLIDEGVTKQKDIKAFKEEKLAKNVQKEDVVDTVKSSKSHTLKEQNTTKIQEKKPESVDILPEECPADEIKNIFRKILNEIEEMAKQLDAPIYEGDRETDYYVRLSDIYEVFEKYQ